MGHGWSEQMFSIADIAAAVQCHSRFCENSTITDINIEDRLVQQTAAEHLEKALGWNSAARRGRSRGESVGAGHLRRRRHPTQQISRPAVGYCLSASSDRRAAIR